MKSETKEYRCWCNMRSRCRNEANYVDRGITVCPEWEDFDVFLCDMGECPEGMTLDRKDNDGNYTPANCRWATYSQQGANRRPFGKHIWQSYNQFILRVQLRPGFRYVKAFSSLEEAKDARADCLFEREIYKKLS